MPDNARFCVGHEVWEKDEGRIGESTVYASL